MTKIISIFIFFMLLSVTAICSVGTVTIGTGTSVQRSPLGSVSGYERSVQLYTAAEMSNTGVITKIEFYTMTAEAVTVPCKMYLKETTATTLTSTTWATQTTGATLVYDSSFTGTIAGGWNEFLTNNYFTLTSGKNLLVLVETNYGGTGSGQGSTSPDCRFSTLANTQERWAQNTTPPTGSGAVHSTRPNVRLTFNNAMTYTSSTTTQFTGTVVAGTNQQPVLGVQIVIGGSGVPLYLSMLSFASNGTSLLSDVANARCYYTGTSSTFSTATQYGSTFSSVFETYYFEGNQTLAAGTNYFWLTYDVSSTAGHGNHIDSECPQVYLDGTGLVQYTPTVTAPSGYLTIRTPLSGTKTIGPGGTYTTFASAITDLNDHGVKSPGLTFNVTSGTVFTEGSLTITATGTASSPIIFQKSSTAHATVKPTLNTSCFDITSSDYITFNGIDVVINSGSYVKYAFYLHGTATDGAQHNTIKNCSITLNKTNTDSKGIYSNSTATSSGGSNSYNHFYNVTISNVYSGIYLAGSSTSGCYDSGNEIGSETVDHFSITNFGGDTSASYGVYATNQLSAKVFETEINDSACTTSSASLFGIYFLGTNSTADIYNNIVQSLQTSSTGYGVYIGAGNTVNFYSNQINGVYSTSSSSYGLYISSTTYSNMYKNNISYISTDGVSSKAIGIYSFSGTTHNIYNNMISHINSPNSTSAPSAAGMSLNSVTTYGIYYNTVKLECTASITDLYTAAFRSTHAPDSIDIRNNIFINKSATGSGTSGKAVVLWRSTNPSYRVAASTNNNLYYAGTPGSKNLIFYDGSNVCETLSSYKLLAETIDQQSFTEDVPFVSSTDLHISLSIPTQVESGGLPITTPFVLNTDYDGITRSAITPDIGADEGTFILAEYNPPVITYSPFGYTYSTSSQTLSNVVITDGSGLNVTSTYKPRVYFKKNTETNSFGANNSGTNGWKWTQTTSSSSPFEFLLDYSLLNSAVVPGDTIQYFVVAQDSFSTPNVGSQPYDGFAATSVIAVSSAPTTPNSYYITPLSGTRTVGPGGDYPTLASAIAMLNACLMDGPTVFQLIDHDYSTNETFPLTIMLTRGASATNTITFAPAPGMTDVGITCAGSASVLSFDGAEYVTFDGDYYLESSTLTMIGNGSSSAAVNIGGTSANNTIRNCIIKGCSTNIFSGVLKINTTTSGNGNQIISCDIGNGSIKPRFGIYLSSSANGSQTIRECNIHGISSNGIQIYSSSSNGVQILNNVFSDFGATAIFLRESNNTTIEGCEISSTNPTSSDLSGISIANAPGTVIRNCRIHNLVGSSTASLEGISISGSYGVSMTPKIYNNEIYLETGASTTTGDVKGIEYNGFDTNSCEIYYNSVYLGGTGVTAGNSYAFLKQNACSNLTIEDNIFMNARSNGTGTGKHCAIGYTNTSTTALTLDRNDYYASGTGGVLGIWNTTEATSLANWKSLSSRDLFSISANPVFGFSTLDYLRPYTISPVFHAGVPITGIVDDIQAVLRSETAPAIGAYETGIAMTIPNSAVLVSPGDTVTNQSTTVSMNWADGGGLPSAYVMNFGTNDPPTNILHNYYLGNVLTYSHEEPLIYGTTYYWQIIPVNSEGDAEDCPIWSFTVMIDPRIHDFPYTENFDTTFPPTGWTVVTSFDPDSNWRQNTEVELNHNTSTGSAAVGYGYDYLHYNYWLITPPILVDANTLRFWARDYLSTELWDYPDEYTWIRISTTTPDTSSFTTTIGALDYLDTGETYKQYAVDLAPWVGQTIYIAFIRHGTGGNYFFLDDLSIQEESLNQPVVILTQTESGVQLDWMEDTYSLGYKIFEASTLDGPWTYLTTTSTNTYIDTNVTEKKFYKVVTTNINVTSESKSYPEMRHRSLPKK